MLQQSPKSADKKKSFCRYVQLVIVFFTGIPAIVQLIYGVSLQDLQESYAIRTENFHIIQYPIEKTKPKDRKCIQATPLNYPNTSKPFNQALKILQEEKYFNSALVFILCANSNSEEISIVTYAQYDWAKTYILPKNIFWGDIYFYTHILENLLVAANYTSEWIGTMPGRSSYRDVYDWNVIWMHRMLSDKSLINEGVDVLVFDDIESVRMTDQNTKWDPLWLDLTDMVFDYMGKGPTNVSSTLIDFLTLHNETFHGMRFVARPLLIHRFIQWIRSVTNYLSTNSQFLKLSEGRPCDELKKIVQQYISTFLVPYFFKSHANQIMTLSDYKTSGNTNRENSNFASELNRKTEEILSSEPNGIPQLFVLCHSSDTCNHASDQFSNYSWGQHLYFIPSTNLLESYFYTNVIENLMESSTSKADWVGSISWKALTKTYVHVIDQMLSDRSLVQDGFDVLGFWTPSEFDPHYCNSTMYIHSTSNHYGLIDFIEYILRGIGESDEHISLLRQPYPTFKSFYGSYFVARPVFMQKYVNWIRRVMVFIAKDHIARTYLWSDSHYNGDASVPLKVYGVQFYPLHPFVGERLMQYFFNSRHAKIALLFEYIEQNRIYTGFFYYPCLWFLDISSSPFV